MRFEVTIVVVTEDDEELINDYGDNELYNEHHPDLNEVALVDAVQGLLEGADLEYCSIQRVGTPVKLKD